MKAKDLNLEELYKRMTRKSGLFYIQYGEGVADFASWMDKPNYQEFCVEMEEKLDQYEFKNKKDEKS